MGYKPMLAFDSNRAFARSTRANLIAAGLVSITWLSGCGGDPAGGGPADADTKGDQASDNGAKGDQASDAGAKGDQASDADARSEQASDAATKGDQAPDASGCGLAFYTDPTCQAWLDAHCCAEQRTCIGNCQAMVACINACPSPRTETCVSNCVASGDIAALNAIADCSKLAPPPPQGLTCAWP